MEWIPVYKDLPECPSRVLATVEDVTVRDPKIADCEYTQEVDMQTGEIFGNPSFRVWAGDGYMDINNRQPFRVTAWMPLPEPYKDTRFRVIITGSNSFDNYKLMCEKLEKIFSKRKPTSIVCGETKGAGELGRRYATEHRLEIDSYPANWNKYGKQAGYLRNEAMAAEADACVAFWDGSSADTKHMIDTARKLGLQTKVIKFEKEN